MFWDGFDYYTTTGFSDVWTNIGNGANFTTGRFGVGQCMYQVSNGNAGPNRTLTNMGLASTATTFIHSFAFLISTTPGSTTTIWAYRDSGTQQVELRIGTANKLIISRNGTTLGTAATALTTNQWYWIEVKIKIDGTTGTYEIMLNGVSDLSATGANTKNTANAYITEISAWPNGTTPTLQVDDMVFQDDNGGTPSYTGESRVITQTPNASGTNTQFTPSTGSNWQNVDEIPRNGDTDYNSDSTVGHKDTYNLASFGVTGTIFGVQMSLYVRKDDVSTRKIKPLCRSGSTDYEGAEVTLGSSYVYTRNQWLTDPNTSAAWTPTNLDAAEFGIEITA